MDADLSPVYDRVMRATRPEEIFAPLIDILPPRLLEEHLVPEMKKMYEILNTEKYSSLEDQEAARIAITRLEYFYKEAILRAKRGIYAPDDFTVLLPPRGSRNITVGGVTYTVGEQFHVGEHSTIYNGRMLIDNGSIGVVIRVANTPSDNPYLFNEIRVLDTLHQQDVGYWRNLPFVFGRFETNDRVGIVYRYFEGHTLIAIRNDSLHRDGLDQLHVVWVMDRMLGLLGYIHKIGLVHGRIKPEHIRVRTHNHNVLLTGWSCSVLKPAITGERIIPAGGIFEAPEVSDSGKVGPWTDIYSLGKTLIWLIGGDPSTNEMPDKVEPKLRIFLKSMVPRNPKARPYDAWKLYKAQNRLKDSLWNRCFRHLDLTNP